MTKKHTTGPWSVDSDGSIEHNNVANIINGADGTMIVYGQINDADARRIVACVNACEGLDTDKLERVPVPFAQMLNVGFMELWEQYTTLKEQRDELLQALQALTHSLDYEDLLHDDQRKAFKHARAIIQAEGEAK